MDFSEKAGLDFIFGVNCAMQRTTDGLLFVYLTFWNLNENLRNQFGCWYGQLNYGVFNSIW